MSKLYYFPASQPSRAVAWFIERHNLNIALEVVDILHGESASPEYTAKNPFQGVPLLEFADGTYLSESSAILNYLAATNKIESEYPVADPRAISRIHEAQLRHDSLTRNITIKVLRPALYGTMGGTALDAIKESIVQNSAELLWALEFVNSVLGKTAFIAGDSLTVADYLVTCELNQLPLLEKFTGDNLRIASYPNIARYLETMKAVDGHDKQLVFLTGLAAKILA
jgi:glutathione S-transferase